MSDKKTDSLNENGAENKGAGAKATGGKNVFRSPKFWIVAGVAVVLVAAIVTVSLVLWKHDKGGTPGVKFYGFTNLIDYADYVPEKQAESLLAHGGLAFEAGAPSGLAAGCGNQAQCIGTELLYLLERIHGITKTLGHLVAVLVQHQTVIYMKTGFACFLTRDSTSAFTTIITRLSGSV